MPAGQSWVTGKYPTGVTRLHKMKGSSMNQFRKSTRSKDTMWCVEVGKTGTVAVRDTKEAHMGEARTILDFTNSAWGDFLAALH